MAPESSDRSRSGEPPAPAAAPRRSEPSAVERAHRTCPICGAELAERKCKLYCPRPGCVYFLSCSDFY